MDACELEKSSEKQYTEDTTRQPLVAAENKNGTPRRSRTREVTSRYSSPPPSTAAGPKRCPSPIVTRKSTASNVSVSPRAISAERKRPSTPSSPRSRYPSTPVRDTAADKLLASRKMVTSKMPESLWPSTMRSLASSFQSDSGSLSISKREKALLHTPSDRTLRPTSSNAASQGESTQSHKPTTPRKTSSQKGKSSADQLENSKPTDSLNAHLLDQHRWPSRTNGKTFTGLSRSDVVDKLEKSSVFSTNSEMIKPSLRRLSLDGAIKGDVADKLDKASVLSHYGTVKPSSRRLSLDGTIKSDVTDKLDRVSVLSQSGVVKPPPRRLSLDGTSKSDATNQIEKATSLSHSGMVKSSQRRLSLDGRIKTDATDQMDKVSSLSHAGMAKPSSRRLSPDVPSKGDSSNQMGKLSRRLSLDVQSRGDSSDQMDKLSRRLSLDVPSRGDYSDQMGKMSSLSHPESPKPSQRRLSLDVAVKSDGTGQMNKVSHSGTVKPSPRRLSLDPTIISDATDRLNKASVSSNSGSSKSPPRRLSLDGTSKPLKKAATDILLQISRDDNVKEMLYGRSIDANLPKLQRPSSSSSSERTPSINAAGRTQSLPITAPHLPLISVSRGVSPSRAKATIPSSRGTSPARLRPSSPSRHPQNSSSVLSYIADAQKANTAENVEDVHQLRLLYNRYLQWRFANARAAAALHSQSVKSERKLYSMGRIIADIWVLMRQKRSKFQQLGLKLKLFSILHNQVTTLDEWASVERDHTNTLTRFTQNLQASTILIPLTRGARGDVNSVKAALYSASHVMQSVESSLGSVLSKVEEMNHLIEEVADVAANERAKLNKCQSLLCSTDAYQRRLSRWKNATSGPLHCR
ncbi:QWRF motif-containing protein 4-like isoform X2 [Andrographis paniculata]|uniref:QWRF motif-containing protein 4-like isoform X2 n=1 Tax=Andrographis paniculata TaxID=175694 RepID=UPI0021E85A41|nr:QWRF motif-containing protein 4-like isoform X2 [Andrographis paniculata]